MAEGIRRRRRVKIVATIGPASSSLERLEELFRTGADVFRLNFSHGTQEDHAAVVERIRRVERRTGRPIGILADLQGPKLRVGRFAGGSVVLQWGRTLRLDLQATPGDSGRVQLPHPEIMAAAGPGSVLLLDDGKVRLEVTRQTAEYLETRVIVGGRLSDHKGVNLPGLVLPIPALTTKDRSDLTFALEHGCDYIGLSFVQRPEDVAEARELVGDRAFILSKIEKPGALQSIDEVMRLSDAIMVARGDLGVEMPAEEVPLIQKRLIRAAHRHGRPVVVATQMMESMIENPTPTRAEASDVATAVFDGADAVMLSAESATGKYPVETVRMMDRIIARTEEDDEARATRRTQRPNPEKSSADAICAAAGQVAGIIDAKAIAAFSLSGATAMRIARERPDVPILGLTPSMETARRLALVWGVHALTSEVTHTMTETVAQAAALALKSGFAKRRDEIVVIAGVPFGRSGGTNSLRVAQVT
ncbi:pyruvate kinase [uncultured Phenylobacterium sp.]|uniref:pyruvate kinase n=1 Tax=uncultured Phenylobacterium sp. TaxID=349273 RepID=UPI0025F6EE9A|nr:pyruvate kinase [uncultured Phenylobacterium sp.]